MTTATPKAPKADRTWLYVALAFLVFWAIYLRVYGPGTSTAPRLEGTGLTQPAEYSWTLRGLDGKPVSFEQFKGKPVFLNVWATWCPPCVREMPSIARLAADPKLKGVAFVCVSVDEQTETVKRFLEGKGWPMTVLRAEGLPSVFSTDGIPATFIIAPDGKVVASEVGSADWDEPEVVAMLEDLQK